MAGSRIPGRSAGGNGKRPALLTRWLVGLLNLGFAFAILGFAVVLFAFWFYGRDLPGLARLADYTNRRS